MCILSIKKRILLRYNVKIENDKYTFIISVTWITKPHIHILDNMTQTVEFLLQWVKNEINLTDQHITKCILPSQQTALSEGQS